MSNKQQLQTNNTKYASLIETLRGKAIPSGEDVTTETNAYTTKLASLETAVAALETELEGKASGGSGGSIETCTVSITSSVTNDTSMSLLTYHSFENGKIVSHAYTNNTDEVASFPFTARNVICGTLINIEEAGGHIGTFQLSGVEWLGSGPFTGKITASAGETATIHYIPID